MIQRQIKKRKIVRYIKFQNVYQIFSFLYFQFLLNVAFIFDILVIKSVGRKITNISFLQVVRQLRFVIAEFLLFWVKGFRALIFTIFARKYNFGTAFSIQSDFTQFDLLVYWTLSLLFGCISYITNINLQRVQVYKDQILTYSCKRSLRKLSPTRSRQNL